MHDRHVEVLVHHGGTGIGKTTVFAMCQGLGFSTGVGEQC